MIKNDYVWGYYYFRIYLVHYLDFVKMEGEVEREREHTSIQVYKAMA